MSRWFASSVIMWSANTSPIMKGGGVKEPLMILGWMRTFWTSLWCILQDLTLKSKRECFVIRNYNNMVNKIMDDKPEWINWKSIVYPHIREDHHHAEIVNVNTGEVLHDTTISSDWDKMEYYETLYRNRLENYYKDKIVRRSDVGDCFCSTDWSKH